MSDARTIEVTLPAELARAMDAAVERGSHADAADYVREVLRKDTGLADQQARLNELLREGLESGPPVELDIETFLRELRAKHFDRESS